MMCQVSSTFALIAEKQLKDGLFEEAINTCKAGLSVYPNYPSAICILAKSYYLSGNIDNANSVIGAALEHFPNSIAIINTHKQITNFVDIFEDIIDYNKTPPDNIIPTEIINNQNIITEKTNYASNEIINEDNLLQAETEELNPNYADIELDNLVENKDTISDEEYAEFDNKKNEISEHLEGIFKLSDMLKQTTASNDYLDDENEIPQDEDIELIDEDIFFPEHIKKDSIANMIDDIDEINITDNVIYEDNTIINEDNMITKENVIIDEDDNSIQEDNNIENNIEEIETNVPSVSNIYKIDLDIERMDIPTFKLAIDFFHIPTNINSDIIKFFLIDNLKEFNFEKNKVFNTDNNNINDYELLPENEIIDEGTMELLEIAKGLENAKIEPIFAEREEEEETDVPLIVSETMAKIYIKQKALDKAIKIYELLLTDKPEKTDYYLEQINLLTNYEVVNE